MNHTEKEGVIISDIGGTNCRIQYFRDKTDTEPIEAMELQTNSFKSMSEFIQHFINQLGEGFSLDNIDLVVCIASKITNNKTVSAANYNWCASDGTQIKKKFGFKDVRLLNDFESCGYGITGLLPNELIGLGGAPAF